MNPAASPGHPICLWEHTGSQLLVTLFGEIDRASEPDLNAVLDALGSTGLRRIVVDMGQTTFFAAAGVNFLARLAAMGDTVELTNVRNERLISRMLQAVGLDAHILISA